MAEIFIVPLNPARKAVLDPAIITTTRPTAVVKQVMRATGMNRTTAARLTKGLRADLRVLSCLGPLAIRDQPSYDAGG
jgi:hypothetical protein